MNNSIRRKAAQGLALGAVACSLSAVADAQEMMISAPELLASMSRGRLVSGSGSAGFGVAGGPTEGLLIGVDLGAALPIAADGTQANLALGVRVGYQLHSGLSLALQYQDLGVTPTLEDGTQWQVLGLGARYEFPFLFPMPYIEVAFGLSFVDVTPPAGAVTAQGTLSVGPGGGVGLGVALPLGHHVAIDVGARDWAAPVEGTLQQVISIQAGVEITFGHGVSFQ